MLHPRAPQLALLVVTALALAGCGGARPGPAATQDGPAPAASEGTSAPPGAAASGGALTGLVGTADDPDAYEIALTDESGFPITSLAAGDYTITFADLSEIHNFRLSGPGDVDVSTEDGPAWTVHGGMPTMVAGIRSLLLQALHPGAMAGVHDWSQFTDSFLICQQRWGTRRRGHGASRGGIPGGADAYVAEWATAGRLIWA